MEPQHVQARLKASRVVHDDNVVELGNFAGGEGSEDFRRLHYEWESGTLPFFAWPTDGDRVKLWGSWIWDCGHFTMGQRVSGEASELHPLNGIVVTRRAPYRTRGRESQADVFISSGGVALVAGSDAFLAETGWPNKSGSGLAAANAIGSAAKSFIGSAVTSNKSLRA